MRFYTESHTHYCGVDLHAKTLYLCVLDRDGQLQAARSPGIFTATTRCSQLP